MERDREQAEAIYGTGEQKQRVTLPIEAVRAVALSGVTRPVSDIGKGLPGKPPQHPNIWSNVGRFVR